MNIFDKKLNIEIINAIIIIGLVSLLILVGFIAGFSLPLFLLIMSVSFLITLVYPRSGIYAIVFLTFIFERFFTLAPIMLGRDEYKLYLVDIILIAIFISFFLRITNFTKLRMIFEEGKYLIVFIILTSIHFFIDIFILGVDKQLAFSSFKYYVFYPLIYFAILILFRNRENVIKLFQFALAGAVGIIFFIIYGIIFGGGLWVEFTPLSTSGIRILAFTHAFYLSMAIITLWVWNLFKNKKSAWSNVLTVIWVIGIVGSMMRHLWIGLVITIITIYFFISKEKRKIFQEKIFKYVLATIFIIMITLFISLIAPYYTQTSKVTDGVVSSIEERVGSFSNVGGDESFFWRELVWKKVIKDYTQTPIWGLGFGKEIFVETDNYRDFVEVRNIHNSWLTLFVQVGPIIFLFFIFFLFKSIKKIFKEKSNDWLSVALIILTVNYFVIAMFQPYFETNMLGIFFWIILGIIGAKNLQSK